MATLGSLGHADPGTCHIGLWRSPNPHLQGKPGLLSCRSSTPTSLPVLGGGGAASAPELLSTISGLWGHPGSLAWCLGWDPGTFWQVPRGSSPGTLVSTCTRELKVPSGACPARQWV